MLRRRRHPAVAEDPAPGTPPPPPTPPPPTPPPPPPPAAPTVRWTVDGPVEVPAEDPPHLSMPLLPSEVAARSASDLAATAPPVTLSMPETTTDVRPGVPAPYAPSPSGTAEAVPDGAASPESPAEDLHSIRARLAARGLVRTEPAVRIRDLAGGRPDGPPAPVTPTKGDPFEAAPARDDAFDRDAEALEPEPSGPTTRTRCPSCRTTQQVAVDATGYRCGHCARTWRWAICGSCSHLTLTPARQESWRCSECGAYSRSWWRTATAPRDASEVSRRKRADAAGREHQRVLAVARRRRWKLVLGGVVIVAAAALAALVFTSSDSGSPAAQARATCATWSRLSADIANGSLTAAELDAALAELSADAQRATAEVQLAADRLATAGRPGSTSFLAAGTELSDACADR